MDEELINNPRAPRTRRGGGVGGGNVPGPTLLATWGLAGGTVPVGPRATRWVQPWKAAQSCIQEGPSILFAFFFFKPMLVLL